MIGNIGPRDQLAGPGLRLAADVTKSHIVVFFIKSLHHSPASSGNCCLPPPLSSTRIGTSSEGLVMGGHSVHFREESKSGLARTQRMLFVQCPEQTLT